MNAFKVLLTLAALSGSASAATHAATYTVSPGDTLTSVAQALNIEPLTLMKRNGLSSSTLQVGQKLNTGTVTTQRTAAQSAPKASASQVAASKPVTTNPVTSTPVTSSKTNTTQAKTRSSGNGYVRTAALRFLGIRYVYGGTGARGLDCSGYTMAVYRSMGISLPRTAAAQSRSGYAVGRGNLQAGDLMFFNTMGRGVSHVAIYLGGGQFANANSYSGRSKIDSLSNPYWSSRYVSARRVL